MPARLMFALHLAAIVALAVGVCVGIVANSTRDRLYTLADLKPRLAGAAVCEVSGTVLAPTATNTLGVPVRKTITDPAVLARLVATMPSAELRPTASGVSNGLPVVTLHFPAEGVTVNVSAGMWTVVAGGDHYFTAGRGFNAGQACNAVLAEVGK